MKYSRRAQRYRNLALPRFRTSPLHPARPRRRAARSRPAGTTCRRSCRVRRACGRAPTAPSRRSARGASGATWLPMTSAGSARRFSMSVSVHPSGRSNRAPGSEGQADPCFAILLRQFLSAFILPPAVAYCLLSIAYCPPSSVFSPPSSGFADQVIDDGINEVRCTLVHRLHRVFALEALGAVLNRPVIPLGAVLQVRVDKMLEHAERGSFFLGTSLSGELSAV